MRIGRIVATVGVALGVAAGHAVEAHAQNLADQLQPDPRSAITRVATRGANFLEIGVGARALALGGASGAAEGLTSFYWNVAGAADVQGVAGAISHIELYAGSGVTHDYAAAALPVGAGVVGLSFTRFSSGDVEVTTEQWPTGGDPSAAGTVAWIGQSIGLHYARTITDRLNLGASGKFVQEGITGATAEYVGFDIAALFRTGLYGITLGASIANVGTSSQFGGSAVKATIPSSANQGSLPSGGSVAVDVTTQRLQLPTTFRFGLHTELYGGPDALIAPNPEHRVIVFGDVSDAITTDLQPSVGFEYGYREMLFARVGKRHFNDSRADWSFSSGLSAGLGLRLPVAGRQIGFDYAYTSLSDALGHHQIISVEYGF